MSVNHPGNAIPEITREEHEGLLNAKRTYLVSAPTLYVESGAGGVGVTTVYQGPGGQPADPWDVAVLGNVTLSDSKQYIGLTTVTPGSAWPDPKTGIGLVSIFGGKIAPVGNITIDSGVITAVTGITNPVALKGNITIDSGVITLGANDGTDIGNVDVASIAAGVSHIGFATVENATAWPDPKTYLGLVTVDIGASKGVTFAGNVTLSDSKTYIGLVTASAVQGGNWDVAVVRGNVTVQQGSDPWNVAVKGNVTLSDSKAYIGLVTVNIGTNRNVALVGNVTLSDSKAFIGLTTVNIGSNNSVKLVGNVTLSDPKTFIGLTTIVYSPPPISTYTSFMSVYSATGNTSIFFPPAGKRWVLKDLHVASLGKAEVAIKSKDSYVIPFTSLATQGGYFEHYGEAGLAAKAANDHFGIQLNGAATISIMVNVRFEG